MLSDEKSYMSHSFKTTKEFGDRLHAFLEKGGLRKSEFLRSTIEQKLAVEEQSTTNCHVNMTNPKQENAH